MQVLREEKKFLIHRADALSLSRGLSFFLKEDAHNGAEGYMVRSLYFDTLYDRDFLDKEDGLENRRKLRLQIYRPDDPFAKLEMKQKQGARQRKRSLLLPREAANRLIKGDYTPLRSMEDPFAKECYGLMETKCYRPKTIVEYHRYAFAAKENNIRITLDSNIVSTEGNMDLFSSHLPMYPVMDPFHVVLEVKYNHFLPSYIKEALRLADKSQLSVSKYCMARQIGCRYQF